MQSAAGKVSETRKFRYLNQYERSLHGDGGCSIDRSRRSPYAYGPTHQEGNDENATSEKTMKQR